MGLLQQRASAASRFWQTFPVIPLPLFGALFGTLLAWGLSGLPLGTSLTLWAGLSVLLYVAASRGPEPLWRGVLIGLNAGLNAAALLLWVGPLGFCAAALNLLAASDLTCSPRFRHLLGWSGWLLPLSWPATLLGLAAFGLNVLAWRSVRRVWVDRGTGSVVMVGGWLWWPGFRGGYSLGQFAFVTPDALGLVAHETGHTLNNAAFGSLFHFIGAADELLLPLLDPSRRWADAYAERLAEGHDPRTRQAQVVGLWANRSSVEA